MAAVAYFLAMPPGIKVIGQIDPAELRGVYAGVARMMQKSRIGDSFRIEAVEIESRIHVIVRGRFSNDQTPTRIRFLRYYGEWNVE